MTLTTLEDSAPAPWSCPRRVLVLLGGQPYRKGVFRRLVVQAKKLKGYRFLIVSLFVEKEGRQGNVMLRRFLPTVRPYLAACHAVLMPAGHSGIMEAIVLQKPLLLIPDAAQPEQLSNARAVEKHGLGLSLEGPWETKLSSALDEVFKNQAAIKKRMARLSKLARGKHNGARNIVILCERMARTRRKGAA